MTLKELQEQVNATVDGVKECGQDPSEVIVSLQIDRENDDSVWSDKDLEIHWDNNGQVSGCVILGWQPAEDKE